MVDPRARASAGVGRAHEGTLLPRARHRAAGAEKRRRPGPDRGRRPLHGDRCAGTAGTRPDGHRARCLPTASTDPRRDGSDRGGHRAGIRGRRDREGRFGFRADRDAERRTGPHHDGLHRAADHAALGEQLRAGGATTLRKGLGPAPRRRLRRHASVSRLAVPLARGDAGGRARRPALHRGGPSGTRSGVLGGPGGAHRRRLVVVDVVPAVPASGVVAPGVPGLPHRDRAGDLHDGIWSGDADLRQGRSTPVRHPGRGARRGDLAGRVRGLPDRLRGAGPGRRRGPDGAASARSARPGPRRVSRPRAGRTRPPRP
jgi:hypothetical protein